MQDIGMVQREHRRLRHIDALSLRLQWLRSVHEALGLENACLLSMKPGKFEKLDELEGFPVYNVRIAKCSFCLGRSHGSEQVLHAMWFATCSGV